MDRKGYKKNKDNIILFPNLEERLLEKGLEKLQQNAFNDAIFYLEQALELTPNNTDALIGLVLAYYESGKFLLAKDVACKFLSLKEDYEALELYLMVLIQLHEYEEIASLLEGRQFDSDLPKEKREHFSKLLNLSRKMLDGKQVKPERRVLEPSLNLLGEKDLNKLVYQASELSYSNIRPYIEEIKEYLLSKDGHPFVKTLLLSILIDQEYDKEVWIDKFKRKLSVIPSQLPSLQEMKEKNDIIAELERVENKDPYLFQQILGLYERHIFLLYPFDWFKGEEPRVWAAAYHLIALKFSGMEKSADKHCQDYQISTKSLEEACNFLRKLEEISYPII